MTPEREAHEDKLIAVLDDVQRAIMKGGIWGRTFALSALRRHFPATPAPAGWQPIETCDTWRFDHMTPMIAYWPTRGPRETYYDVDEEFHLRPKGWASPEEGWRSPGDQCIPIESHQPTHWREFPAAPTAPAEGGV